MQNIPKLPNASYVLIVWHEDMIGSLNLLHATQITNLLVLISPSKDGESVVAVTEYLNSKVSINRGSSSKSPVAALKFYRQGAKAGKAIWSAVDGPRGPRGETKRGLIVTAITANIPIYCLRFSYSSCKRFAKAWDKHSLPLPFSKINTYLSEPIQPKEFIAEQATDLSKKDKATALAKYCDEIMNISLPKKAFQAGDLYDFMNNQPKQGK